MIAVEAATVAVAIAGIVFIVAAGLLNPLCLVLSPVALAWILAYSYAKRFTHWPHLWLGLSLAIAPVGGWLAVTGRWSIRGGCCWRSRSPCSPGWPGSTSSTRCRMRASIATPDCGSAVVRLGSARAICSASCCTASRFRRWRSLAGAPASARGTTPASRRRRRSCVYEHRLVQPGDLSRLDAAFFTMNGVMSLTVFGFAVIDRVVAR